MALVSIVVPCFNIESLLPETIESVLNQSLVDNWEMLLVNDGSTDGTQEVIDRYRKEDNRIRHLTLDSNLGIPAARNLGTRATAGKYLMHLDADDCLTPLALSHHLDAIRDADVSYSGYTTFEKSPAEPLSTVLDELANRTLLSMMTSGADKGRWWIPPGAMLVKRSADTEARKRFTVWPKQIQTATEAHYYTCLYKSGAQFAPTNSVELYYRKHAASDGATVSWFDLANGYRWMLEYWIKELPDEPELLRRKYEFFRSLQVGVNVETAFLEKRL